MYRYYKGKKSTLSIYVGRYLARHIKWIKGNEMVSPKEVNSWDRVELAKGFVEEYLEAKGYDTIGGEQNKTLFIDDIRITIDRLLPNSYYTQAKKYLEGDKVYKVGGLYGSFRIDKSLLEEQLKYQFKENIEYKLKGYGEPATEKQLLFLTSLCEKQNMTILDNKIPKKVAKVLIGYLIGETLMRPSYFDMFIDEKQQ